MKEILNYDILRKRIIIINILVIILNFIYLKSGWQAVDATPQEGSNGISQCGPAPLTAIKKGETFLNFETNFLYGEVNADRCTWLCEVN